MKKVLLTGISGFLGQHCALELLKKGYAVRGSIRSFSKQEVLHQTLGKLVGDLSHLEFCELDLLKDDGWKEAMEGCDYLLHVASPFVIAEPKDENELIKPAYEGTLRALKAAKQAGIKKVVLTSSTVAMAGDKKKTTLTQKSWTDTKTDRVSAYIKSKTIAEKAAWDFYHNQDQEESEKMELSVINPGPIYGPSLTGDLSGASMGMIKKVLTGELSTQPKCHYIISDVRDVAQIHVAAMENEESNGKRYLVTSAKPHSFISMAKVLKNNGYEKVRPKEAPSFLLKFVSLFDREVKGLLPFIDAHISADIRPTQDTFAWQPIPFEKTMLDTARSIEPFLPQEGRRKDLQERH